MSPAPSPSWYDLLDVDQDAGTDEIRAAWKAAIADLEPTDRRFRVLNQAAEVLLDPEARAAYDAGLAEEVETPVDDPVDEPAPARDVRSDEAPPRAEDLVAPAPAGPDDAPLDEPDDAPVEGSEPTAGRSRRPAPFQVPVWALAALAVATAVLVGLTVWQAQTPSPDDVEDGARAAQSAAERAAVPVLSYDYRTLDEDQAESQRYLTAKYRKEYDRFFDGVVRENAGETKAVVEAEVVSSALVRSGEDRVQVLVFVNRPTTNAKQTTPEVFRDQVTITMARQDDGAWLVDDMVTTGPAA
ncbi:J domain-containing protein [Nocardioides sp. SYSU D00038]|uniref:J domain-containing protein n=1 Tax=Nocardioides sp. SYSU D00038 TaxID=2812554 RepID=UPI00196797A0|nr:DnaJ domain-containing protein [Nocardioides sp. SYSU D00038]